MTIVRTSTLIASLLLLLVRPALAEVRTGTLVTVGKDEVIAGNLYAAGQSVVVHGEVKGDVVAAGRDVLVDGVVGGDVLAAGGEVTVNGQVRGDVRLAGSNVALQGNVGGDAQVAGGSVRSDTRLTGEVMMAGGTVELGGAVEAVQPIHVAAGTVTLNAPVAGDVVARANLLRLGSGAWVKGNVEYEGVESLERNGAARVDGTVREVLQAPPVRALWMVSWLHFFSGLFVFGLLWLTLFRRFVGVAMETLQTRPGASVGVGVLVLLGAPLALFTVMAVGAVLGGMWMAFAGAAVYAIALATCVPLVALTVGTMAANSVGRGSTPPWLILLLSLMALTLLLRVPGLGPLLGTLCIGFGLGAVALSLMNTLTHTRTPYEPTPPTTARPVLAHT